MTKLSIVFSVLLVINYRLVAAQSESSTCFLQSTQTYGYCEHGCCGTQLDRNQRCCKEPSYTSWIIAVSILGGALAITWIVCGIFLFYHGYINSKKANLTVTPSKKKGKEKKTHFVNPTPEGFYTYPAQPPHLHQELPQLPRLKSSLKNSRTHPDPKGKDRGMNMYPVKKYTEFTQVSYQPQSRSSGYLEWASANRESQSKYSGDRRHIHTLSQTPDSYN